MATYDPPQPMWKRNVAGILDFLLAAVVFGYLASKLPGNEPTAPLVIGAPGTKTVQLFGVGGWPTLVMIVLVIVYFVVLGRTGGTVFQRLFGMTRAR